MGTDGLKGGPYHPVVYVCVSLSICVFVRLSHSHPLHPPSLYLFLSLCQSISIEFSDYCLLENITKQIKSNKMNTKQKYVKQNK